MAIIEIPSSNIYSIDNQKVITNKIDRIDASVNNGEIVNETTNVYNETVKDDNLFVPSETQKSDISYSASAIMDQYDGYGIVVSYIEATPTYLTKKFIIPNNVDNKKIIKLLVGEDKNGFPNINYSCFGYIKKGNVSGSVSGKQGNVISIWNFSNLTINEGEETFSDTDRYSVETEFSYTYSKKIQGAHYSKNYSTTANLVLSNSSNILNPNVKYNENNIEVELTILCGIKVYFVGGDYYMPQDFNAYNPINIPLNGTYEKYIPKEVNVSFSGNTIKIDLKNEEITFGDGENVYSFSGNELIQTTNTPTQQQTYQKVIDEWKNGREVAEIKCAIADYYDNEGNLVISPNKTQYKYNKPYTVVYESKDTPIQYLVFLKNGNNYFDLAEEGDLLWYEDEYAIITNVNVVLYPHALYAIKVIENGKIAKLLEEHKEFVINYNEKPSASTITFHIGDLVIPYVYGANGKDKPMSLNKDGTSKIFEVLGKKIIYDGAVWQTLSLQENTKNT